MLPRIIQVEVSTRCQLRCRFCPRTLLKDRWVSLDINREWFTQILPYVRNAELVHLQGWGEPLLHPDIWNMARAIKERGGRVSLTTNGVLLNDSAVQQICQIGFAFIAVSVAGAKSATHDSLRAGSSLEQICKNIAGLSAARSHPDIHLVMQMMKSNVSELPALVDLAAELKADRVIAPNLDYIPDAETEALKTFGTAADPHLHDIVEEAEKRGKKRGIQVYAYPLESRDNSPLCSDDPLHNTVVSVRGEVSPCVYLCLPVEGTIPRISRGRVSAVDRFIYGNAQDGLDKVLENAQAKEFRLAFDRRVEYSRLNAAESMALLTLPGIRGARKILQGQEKQPLTEVTEAMPPAPAQCRGCYKLQGI
ncbi:MAG: radical SAM/SPASM domain-containing protein [Dehalococcoidia bacterium]|nr:radical SAM/SPASM domain-containing protein [Dehalococcoidia bacterium]